MKLFKNKETYEQEHVQNTKDQANTQENADNITAEQAKAVGIKPEKKASTFKIAGLEIKRMWVYAGSGLLGALILMGVIAAAVSNNDGSVEQQAQQEQVTQQAQQGEQVPVAGEGQADKAADPNAPLQEQTPAEPRKPDYVQARAILETLDTVHWARQENPVATLIRKKLDEELSMSGKLKVAENAILMNGKNVAMEDPIVVAFKNNVIDSVGRKLGDKVRIGEDVTGTTYILTKSTPEQIANGFPEFDTVKESAQYDAIANEIANAVKTEYPTIFMQAESQVPREAVAPQVQVVDTGISDKQRREFKQLIDDLRAWNDTLRRENEDLRRQLVEQTQQMAKTVQQLEDSPKAQNKLKAIALAKDLGYELSAIQGDLIFLKMPNGKITSYRIGDLITGTDLRISSVDTTTGLVYLTKK